jgi:predicted N-acyltransferase
VNAGSGQIRLAEDLDQIPAAAWQDLVAGHPALRLEVLRAVSNSARRPLSLQCFLLEDSRGIAAAAVCETLGRGVLRNPLDELLFGRAAGPLRRLGCSSQPVLLCHNPARRQVPVILRSSPAAERRRVLEELLDRIEAHAASRGYGVAFAGVTAEDDPLSGALRARGYSGSAVDATARMDVVWTDFNGYVEHLRRQSRNAAGSARMERNRNRKNGVSIRRVQLTAANAPEAYALICAHHRRKNGTDLPFGPEYLSQLVQSLGEDLLAFEAVRGGERVAILTAVRSQGVAWMALAGIEQRDRPNDFTYANLLFYHTADWAPALGLTTLLYGTGVQQAKRRRGCQLLPSHLYYRPHGAIGRMLARPYLRVHEAWHRRKSARA